jgi:hypothetical protein
MQKVLDIGAGGAEWANNFGMMLLPYMQYFAHYQLGEIFPGVAVNAVDLYFPDTSLLSDS